MYRLFGPLEFAVLGCISGQPLLGLGGDPVLTACISEYGLEIILRDEAPSDLVPTSSCCPVFIIIVSVNRVCIIIVRVNHTSLIGMLVGMSKYNYSWFRASGPSAASVADVQKEFPRLITLPDWAPCPLCWATQKTSLLTIHIT